jgi:hypothetical protein
MTKQPQKRASTRNAVPPKSLCKELEDMRRNPRADWQISDLQQICKKFGLVCSKPRGGGSHYKISSPLLEGIQIVPARRPIKAPYIRSFVTMMDAHIEASANGGDDV